MIVGIENRDGNANVKFHQSNTLEHIFARLEKRPSCLYPLGWYNYKSKD
ncbi:hypothetical protein EVA_15013 [gut metagenome]|uniref:Uncharacterized protein n=1 Tax=gut metagenome TaxID=749906 RepID=J9FQU4_9ZZZZ